MSSRFSLIFLAFTFMFAAVSVSARTGELPIPPLLESKVVDGVRVFNLRADEGSRSFFKGAKTRTLGYNGNYLGPTIRASEGERVEIRVENRLENPTTVHWHGMDVPPEADGNVHQMIPPGKTWSPSFTIRQPAATLWYHPHLFKTTAKQVYQGLAGLFIVDDETSGRLGLPEDYGIDDLPIILQDRRFDSSGRFSFSPNMRDVMHGYQGNTLLVNGAVSPEMEVSRKPLRLRILNGGDSAVFRLHFEGMPKVYQVASDGGFLAAPVPLTHVVLSPSERVEVILDLAQAISDTVTLVTETHDGRIYRALTFHLSGASGRAWKIPASLTPVESIPVDQSARTRHFLLASAMGARMTINGRVMDMNRVDLRVGLGNTEIWEIENGDDGGRRENRGGMMGGGMISQPHNFHVHAVRFLILDINGRPPPPSLSGWKDTVLLWPGDKVRIIARFDSYPGLYMYHCHLLVHEDAGMMGQFMIE